MFFPAMCVLAVLLLVVVFWPDGKKKLLAKLEGSRNKALGKIDELEALDEQYWVESVVKTHRETMYCLALSEKGMDVKNIQGVIRRYESIATAIHNVYLSDPASQLKKKFYDPLDDSVLTDPVDLVIEHPKEGRIALKVNSWNKRSFDKYGPSAFGRRLPSAYTPDHKYYMLGGGHCDGGFDLIGFPILQELFSSHGTQGMFYNVQPCVGGGGEFSGAGASGEWTDPTVVAMEETGTPVLEEVFAVAGSEVAQNIASPGSAGQEVWAIKPERIAADQEAVASCLSDENKGNHLVTTVVGEVAVIKDSGIDISETAQSDTADCGSDGGD